MSMPLYVPFIAVGVLSITLPQCNNWPPSNVRFSVCRTRQRRNHGHAFLSSPSNPPTPLIPIWTNNQCVLLMKLFCSHHFFLFYAKWYLTYATSQASGISYLTQTSFAAFGKGVQLISGFNKAETEQLHHLTSPWSILIASLWLRGQGWSYCLPTGILWMHSQNPVHVGRWNC